MTSNALAENFEGTYDITTTNSSASSTCGISGLPLPGTGNALLNLDLNTGDGTLRWGEDFTRRVFIMTDEVAPGVYQADFWPGNVGNLFGDFPYTITVTDTAVNIDFSWSCIVGDETLAGDATFDFERDAVDDDVDDDVVDDDLPDACEEIVWINDSPSADFEDADNWEGGEIPANEDTPGFNRTGEYEVTFQGNGSNDALAISNGSPTLNLNGFIYTLSQASSCADSVNIDDGAQATFRTGTVNAQDVAIGSSSDQLSTLDLTGGSFLLTSGDLVIGGSGSGSLRVGGDNESGVLASLSDITLAKESGSGGNIIVEGANSTLDLLSDEGELSVGLGGQATLLVTSGATVDIKGKTFIARNSSAGGGLAVSNEDTTWTNDGEMIVGSAAGTNATLLVEDQADMTLRDSLRVAEMASSQGSVVIRGEQTDLFVEKFMVVGQGGTGTMTISDKATVTSGTNDASDQTVTSIAALQGSRGTITVSDTETLWDSLDTINVGFAGQGELFIRDGALVTSPDALIGVQSTGRGEVILSDGGRWSIDNNIQVGVAGFGCVEVDAQSLLDVNGIQVSGRLVASGIFIGNAAIAPGTGARAPRGASVPTTGIVTTSLIIEEGAEIEVDQITLAEGGMLGGDGEFDFDIDSPGMISPGKEECSAGTFTVNGDYTQSSTGELHIELGGALTGEHDSLVVRGTASLAGALQVSVIDGFLPRTGDTFEILTADSISGTFGEVSGSGVYDVSYQSDRVILTVITPPAGATDDCGAEFVTLGCGCGAGSTAMLPCILLGLSMMKRGRRLQTKP